MRAPRGSDPGTSNLVTLAENDPAINRKSESIAAGAAGRPLVADDVPGRFYGVSTYGFRRSGISAELDSRSVGRSTPLPLVPHEEPGFGARPRGTATATTRHRRPLSPTNYDELIRTTRVVQNDARYNRARGRTLREQNRRLRQTQERLRLEHAQAARVWPHHPHA